MRKEINSVYAAGKSIAIPAGDPSPRRSISRGQMTDIAQPDRIAAFIERVRRQRAAWIGFAVHRGDRAAGSSRRCSSRAILFPSLIDVFWRCLDIFADWTRCSGTCWRRCCASWPASSAPSSSAACSALLMERSQRGRQVSVADPDAVSGHPGAVLGGVRHHLVSTASNFASSSSW